jgi:molybdate transport system substrate-binding protein
MQVDQLVRREIVLLLGGAAVALVALSVIVRVSPVPNPDNTISVFAAASMENALDDINGAFTKSTGVKVNVDYGTTSVLIKQVAHGPAPDVFVSADLDAMDFGSRKKLIKDDTRVNLLGNQLVLIASKYSNVDSVVIGPNFAELVGNARIVIGDVERVSAGRYAKAALEKLGAWQAVAPKLVMMANDNVRPALARVARGEVPFGIVYATAAKLSPNVKVIGTFPADSHPAIVYPVAATVAAKPEAGGYLAYLRSTAAKETFESYGFKSLIEPNS